MASTDKQHSVVLAKAIAAKQRVEAAAKRNNAQDGSPQNSKDKIKQRFRERMATKMRNNGSNNSSPASNGISTNYAAQDVNFYQPPLSGNGNSKRKLSLRDRGGCLDQNKVFSSAGEEMFQHLDFYERSLRAVKSTREVGMN